MRKHFKQPKMNTKRFFLTLLLCFVASAQAATDICCAEPEEKVLSPNVVENQTVKPGDSLVSKSLSEIYPYLNVDVLQDFDTHSKTGIGLDAFIPVVETGNKLFFSNVKVNDYSNKTFDGGVYFGYRQLLPEEQKLYGVYTAFDFKKAEEGNYFKQITLGTEYWLHQWFFGYKMFSPIGNSENSYERAVPGVDAEIGYEFSKKTIVYVGGYYLNTLDTSSAPGVRIKLKQNLFSKATGSGILDQVNLEVGAQRDKLKGTRVFAELKFQIGASYSNSAVNGVAAHMADTISRNRIFIEKKARNENIVVGSISDSGKAVEKNKTLVTQCSYLKNGSLVRSGSSSLCPTSRNAVSSAPGVTLIDEVEGRGYDELTLEIPYNK